MNDICDHGNKYRPQTAIVATKKIDYFKVRMGTFTNGVKWLQHHFTAK